MLVITTPLRCGSSPNSVASFGERSATIAPWSGERVVNDIPSGLRKRICIEYKREDEEEYSRDASYLKE